MPSPLHAVGSISSADLATAVGEAGAALDDAHAHDDPVGASLDILRESIDGLYVAALAVEHDRLWIVRASGYTMIPDGLGVGEGIVGRAVRTGRAQTVLDVSRDPDFVAVAPGIASELAVPLLVAHETIGVLNIETHRSLPHDAPQIVAPYAAKLAPHVDRLGDAAGLDLPALARFFVYVSSLRDPRQIAEVAARALSRALPLDACHVVLDGHGAVSETSSWSRPGGAVDLPAPDVLHALCEDLDLGTVFRLVDLDDEPVQGLAHGGIRSVVLLPLRANGLELGTVVGLSRTRLDYQQRDAETAALVAAHAAASIESALALSSERQNALTDELTGLLNRRGFQALLDAEIVVHHEDRAPVTILVFDLDDFKEINDRAGHEFGDALLREAGIVVTAVLPDGATAGRLGGDEFAITLPSVEGAAGDLPDDLRQRIVAALADAGFPVRVSLGVATYPFDGATSAQLLRAADQALYAAKGAGKDCVVRFRDVVTGRSESRGAAAADRPRRRSQDATPFTDVLEAAATITRETTEAAVLERLAKAATFLTGSTGCAISRLSGRRLADTVSHALRDVDIGEDIEYLIDDFPVTREALERQETRALSFLDEGLDQAEAFVLRELRMNCCLLVPLVVDGRSWGLLELYDMRLRRFAEDEAAAVAFLAAAATSRMEALGSAEEPRRRLPLFRVPAAG